MTSRILTALLALGVVGIGVYAYTSRSEPRRPRPKQQPQTTPQPGPVNRSGLGPGSLGITSSGTIVAPESRFFCTQADQAGLFTVSYRGLRSDLSEQQRLPPGFAPPGPLGAFTLYLQVTGADELLPLRRLDTSSLKLVDNTGFEIVPADAADKLPEPVAFPGGHVYSIKMKAPAPKATALRSIDGTLAGFGLDKDRPAVRFHIANIPLPNGPRLFGRASALHVPGLTDAPSLKVVTGDAVDEALKGARPASIPDSYTPQRMLLSPGLPTEMKIPLPSSGRPIQVQADLGPMGLIQVDVRQDAERWHGNVWDGDTLLFAPRASGTTMAVRITREGGPAPATIEPGSMFPPVDGSPAGMIHTTVLVNGRPFGKGMLRITLSHNDSGSWSAPRSSLVGIHDDGSIVLPNLAAGEYRMERPASSLNPYLPGIEQPAVDSYIRYRFGAVAGKWKNEKTSFTVRSSQETRVSPLEWRPVPKTRTTS